MAKASKKAPKKRASKYEEKVSFGGTFEDMIGISVKQSGNKVAKHKKMNHIVYHITKDGNTYECDLELQKSKDNIEYYHGSIIAPSQHKNVEHEMFLIDLVEGKDRWVIENRLDKPAYILSLENELNDYIKQQKENSGN